MKTFIIILIATMAFKAPAPSGPAQSLYERDWRYITNGPAPAPGPVSLKETITVRPELTQWNAKLLSWTGVGMGVATDEVISFHATGMPSWTNFAPHSNNTFAFLPPSPNEPFQFQVVELATNGLPVGRSTNMNFQVVTNFSRNGKYYIGQAYTIAGRPYLGWLTQPGAVDTVTQAGTSNEILAVVGIGSVLEQWRIPDTNWYGLIRQ